MAIDSRGIEYDPFLPSVQTQDGAVFQVITDTIDTETGMYIVDMDKSVLLAELHNGK